ncbi:GSCOCG00010926001-RA-CDS, partial [Cotesia congregata]
MPKSIKDKKAVVNIHNNDNLCFLWAVVAAFHPAPDWKNVSRVTSYPHYSQVLNYSGIKFPITLKDIPRFEKMNNLSINVYVQSDDTKMNIDDDNFENRVNNFERNFHFATIRDLSRLLSSQILQHNGRKFFCDRCLCHFQDLIVFNEHRRDCIQINKVKIELP